jgi:hypothetical protein
VIVYVAPVAVRDGIGGPVSAGSGLSDTVPELRRKTAPGLSDTAIPGFPDTAVPYQMMY